MATDLADYLVERGVSFREAHAAVGHLVRLSEESGIDLDKLPRSVFTAANARFGDDVLQSLSAVRSVGRREVDGGTGPNAVKAQLELAQQTIEHQLEARGNEFAPRVV